MSKRLQVLFEEEELREIQQAAHARKITVAEWVRQTLRSARNREPLGDNKKKLDVVRAAAKFSFPTANIDQMIAEIESGYGDREKL
jgi:hypothetical protein